MDVDIAKLKLAYDDRINRKIPNPAGIGRICEPSESGQEPWGTVVKVIIFDQSFNLFDRLSLSGMCEEH